MATTVFFGNLSLADVAYCDLCDGITPSVACPSCEEEGTFENVCLWCFEEYGCEGAHG